MKSTTPIVVVLLTSVAAITAVVLAAAPQPPKMEPVLTIKANGKPVAVLTVLGGDGPIEFSSSQPTTRTITAEDDYATTKWTGDVKVRLWQAGKETSFEIKAEEIQKRDKAVEEKARIKTIKITTPNPR